MFELIGLGRFLGVSYPNLLVPLFKNINTNSTYVHELNSQFYIKRFKICSTRYFEVLPCPHHLTMQVGGLGLICFELDINYYFVGNVIELAEWWPIRQSSLPENCILFPLVANMIGQRDVDKVSAWRKYINFSIGKNKLSSEIVEAKHAEVQLHDRLWQSLEEPPNSKSDQDELFLKNLHMMSKSKIIAWLSDYNNFHSHNWKVVWEYADRHVLQTEETKAVIWQYLAYYSSEETISQVGDINYLLRRMLDITNLFRDPEFDSLVANFFVSGIILFQRSRVLISDIKKEIIHFHLHSNDPSYLMTNLFSVLDNGANLKHDSEDSSIELPVSFKNLNEILKIIKSNVQTYDKFSIAEIQILVSTYLVLLYTNSEKLAGASCIRTLNAILRPFGLNTQIIRNCWGGDEDDPFSSILERVNLKNR